VSNTVYWKRSYFCSSLYRAVSSSGYIYTVEWQCELLINDTMKRKLKDVEERLM